MKPTNARIAALRQAMQAQALGGYLIPCSDPHADEFLPAHFTACNWFSGFTGDSCTFALTAGASALWCDGRYFVQAEEELAGTEVQLMKLGEPETPTPEAWLAEALAPGQALGIDGDCVSRSLAKKLEKALAPKGCTLRTVDLIGPVWGKERPPLPDSDCWLLPDESAGCTIAQKLAQVRQALAEQKADALLESRLDCVAWLLNLRALDIDCTPYALAFCYLSQTRCVLFAQNARGRFPEPVQQALAQAGVTLAPYEDVVPFCAALQEDQCLLCDPAATSSALYQTLAQAPALQLREGASPIPALKAVKNAGEQAATKAAHLQDALAMVRFQFELEQRLAAGEPLDELDIDPMLHRQRSALPGFVVESFSTIAAWGPNAASMHYHAEPGHHSPIGDHGFLLVDCGGTYTGGTTDITRTYPVGPLTRQEREFYTWTLQSHIEMARAVWLDYCTGGELDTLAREPLWRHGINYRCGTGHGVAHVGMVHEGPQSLRPHNSVTFRPGMVITDEPGVYEAGQVGIRIENELLVVEHGKNQYGRWLAFEPLTWVPIALEPVLPELLTREQVEWLNWYHGQVYAKLSPRLTPELAQWLAQKTAPLAAYSAKP